MKPRARLLRLAKWKILRTLRRNIRPYICRYGYNDPKCALIRELISTNNRRALYHAVACSRDMMYVGLSPK